MPEGRDEKTLGQPAHRRASRVPAKLATTHGKPFTVDDLYLHRKITEVHAVRGSEHVVATVRAADRENDRYTSSLWSFRLDGKAPRQLTRGAGLDRSPRISPCGKRIAFLSDRSNGLAQVHILDLAGGEARQCGNLPAGVSSLAWRPDSKSLLIAAIVNVDSSRRGQPATGKPAKVEVAWRLPYKSDGAGFLLSRQVHLFALDASTGKAEQLTHGPFDVLAFDPSPDGKRVAYVRTREGRFAHRTDLWVCDRDGSGAVQLTDQLATVTQPRWSPDGRCIALAGAQAEGDGQSALYAYDVESRRLERLGGDDVEVAALNDAVHWMGDAILFARATRGCHVACRIARDGTNLVNVVAQDQQFGSLACTSSAIVFAREHPAQPSNLFAFSIDEGRQERLSDLNAWWGERTQLEAARRNFTVPDGQGGTEQIEGWILRAASSPHPQPLLNDVHGGPASYALLDYDTNVFWQVLCSQGWTILALNAVGSGSYGRDFCTRLNGHWGELDLPQHLEALRQLQEEGIADARISICGKSYGGFLSAWAIGHDDRFKAAVVMAPVGNIETHYGTSDGGYFADPLYLAGTPPLDRRLARALSPLQYIEKSTTPTLFLQGKDDERCPKCQSEEMFVSLYCAGTTKTELVLYPGENHHFLGEGAPACREDAATRIVEWLTQHAGSATATIDNDAG